MDRKCKAIIRKLSFPIDGCMNYNVQLWYDQYLPASVTEVHKNCMTELFGLEKTPEEIGQEQDAAMQKALAE